MHQKNYKQIKKLFFIDINNYDLALIYASDELQKYYILSYVKKIEMQ